MNEERDDDRPRVRQADAFFKQGDAVRDYVFPLYAIDRGDTAPEARRFLGTGFFLGRRNRALTAAHVLKAVKEPVAALLADETGWRAYAVQEFEIHPSEDVAVMTIEPPASGQNWTSITHMWTGWEGSSAPYHLWGYPEDAAYELVNDDQMVPRPDLVYSEGHVRRRLTGVPLPNIQGSQFFELSGVAGGGCSGSPVLRRQPGQMWDLIPIYVGERLNQRATSVGYAVRMEEVREWAPELVGHSLLLEANNDQSPTKQA